MKHSKKLKYTLIISIFLMIIIFSISLFITTDNLFIQSNKKEIEANLNLFGEKEAVIIDDKIKNNSDIFSYVQNLKIDKTGYAYIISSQGIMGKVGLKKVIQNYNEIRNYNFVGSGGFVDLTSEVVTYNSIGNTSFKLIVVHNKSEIYKAINDDITYLVLFAIIRIIGSFIFVSLIYKFLVENPLNILIKKVNKIFNNDYSKDDILNSVIESKNEFSVLAISINDMVKSINEYIEKLNGKNKELEESKRHISNLAYYDRVTKIPNRLNFSEKVQEGIEEFNNKGTSFAILFMDLDNFKFVNDFYGHSIGDKILYNFANELNKLSHKYDLIISRFGGDEFTILIKNPIENMIEKITDEIHRLLSKPFYIEAQQFFISVSIGVTFCPKDGITIDELLKNADTAMYKAKEDGKNQTVLFNKEMKDKLVKKTELKLKMREAIDCEQFSLNYQPLYHINKDKIFGFEALIRWKDNGITISPLDFIPIAEETKLIIPLGYYIFKEVCKFIKNIRNLGYYDIKVAVNVSVIQLTEKGFSDNVLTILEKENIPYECIEIEITESKLMESYDFCKHNIEKLTKKGIEFAIDDFGTGYSSLNYLKKLPLSIIKIDKSFIDDLLEAKSRSFAEAIIVLSHTINLKVIAEGVEKKEQFEVLKGLKCDIIQGYYISKPLKEEEAIKMLMKNKGTAL